MGSLCPCKRDTIKHKIFVAVKFCGFSILNFSLRNCVRTFDTYGKLGLIEGNSFAG